MSTYGDKIEKYEARIRKAQELGEEPRENDMIRLYYYIGRAVKKGLDHEVTPRDKPGWQQLMNSGSAGKALRAMARATPQIMTVAGAAVGSKTAEKNMKKIVDEIFGDSFDRDYYSFFNGYDLNI